MVKRKERGKLGAPPYKYGVFVKEMYIEPYNFISFGPFLAIGLTNKILFLVVSGGFFRFLYVSGVSGGFWVVLWVPVGFFVFCRFLGFQIVSESEGQKSESQRVSESESQRVSQSERQRVRESASQRGSESESQRVRESASQRIRESESQNVSES